MTKENKLIGKYINRKVSSLNSNFLLDNGEYFVYTNVNPKGEYPFINNFDNENSLEFFYNIVDGDIKKYSKWDGMEE